MPKISLPSDEGYAKAMDAIMETATGPRENYPTMKDKTLEVLQPSVPEASLAPEVAGARDPGRDGAMGGEANGKT